MKETCSVRLLGWYLAQLGRQELSSPCRREILAEYRRIMARAGEIGRRNPLLSAYALGAWFIAMNRRDGLSPEQNCRLLTEGLRRSRLFRAVMGDAEHYLSPKRVEKQKRWAERTRRRQYEHDWVAELLPGNGDYALGYDYLECGICKLCRAEGCPELARYLCRLDHMFAEVMGLRLERTTTLAQGGTHCDFRFYRVP